MSDESDSFMDKVDSSAVLTVIGIILLFRSAVIVTLIAPNLCEKEWTSPSSPYQSQMYEVADPMLYISNRGMDAKDLQFVYHIEADKTLLAFNEGKTSLIVAPQELEKYITRFGEKQLRLTSRLLLLRAPQTTDGFDAVTAAKQYRELKQREAASTGASKVDYEVLELFVPEGDVAFAVAETDGVLENWVDADYLLLEEHKQPWHGDPGVIYVSNPQEFRVRDVTFGPEKGWRYDPLGAPIASLEELRRNIVEATE